MAKIKTYRFFFHYYRQYDCLSIHFKGKCYRVKEVRCGVPSETKRRDEQPRLIVQGFCRNIVIDNEIAEIV